MSLKSSAWRSYWNKAQHPAVVSTIAFLVAAISIGVGIDRPPTDAFHDYMRPYDPILQAFTILGDGRFLIPACIIVAFAYWARTRRRPTPPLLALSSMLASGALTQLLKTLIGRPRPYAELDTRYSAADLNVFHWFTINKDFASFPSGHSTAVFSIAWFAILNLKSRAAQIAVFVFACLVALTRVALWKHYFADTLAGAAIGIAVSELIAASSGLTRRPQFARTNVQENLSHPS